MNSAQLYLAMAVPTLAVLVGIFIYQRSLGHLRGF
jgi:hypothetical protein